jgi:hypothetical protein
MGSNSDVDTGSNTTCYSCGEALKDFATARIVTISGQQYHESCSVVINCDNCRKIIGFMGRGDITSNRTINCVDCAQPRQIK